MISVWVLGGLGNQLFQYALYFKLTKENTNVCLDLSDFRDYDKHNGYELEKVFGLHCHQCEKTTNSKYNIISKIIFRLEKFIFTKFDVQVNILGNTYYEFRNVYKNEKLFKKHKPIYLKGYWQRESYLKDIRSELQHSLRFKNTHLAKDLESEVKCDTSILIHVRGGDYRDLGWELNREYYLKSLSAFNHIKNPSYYIITNDIEYLNNLSLPIKYTIIDSFHGEESYLNMYLFSKAKNIILANSTFSWWGAYLNSSPNKIVKPKNWIPGKHSYEIYSPENWIEV
jgi:hypothetical protein